MSRSEYWPAVNPTTEEIEFLNDNDRSDFINYINASKMRSEQQEVVFSILDRYNEVFCSELEIRFWRLRFKSRERFSEQLLDLFEELRDNAGHIVNACYFCSHIASWKLSPIGDAYAIGEINLAFENYSKFNNRETILRQLRGCMKSSECIR